MLVVDGLEARYGDSKVLYGVSFRVAPGEVVSLLGRNGMGKTTTVRTIMGLTRACAGSVRFHGLELVGKASHRIARAGLGLVPEGRQVFPNLRVWENLEVARPSPGYAGAGKRGGGGEWNVERVFALFPALGERRNSAGSQLSGGEQQMLAIGRALMTDPSLMILDEATEGLAPLVRATIWQSLEVLKARGQSILLIDKNLDALLRIADRHYVMEKGRVVWQGESAALANDEGLKNRYLGV
jgi:branched-chain amino acid transport system ATP-binding protein